MKKSLKVNLLIYDKSMCQFLACVFIKRRNFMRGVMGKKIYSFIQMFPCFLTFIITLHQEVLCFQVVWFVNAQDHLNVFHFWLTFTWNQ